MCELLSLGKFKVSWEAKSTELFQVNRWNVAVLPIAVDSDCRIIYLTGSVKGRIYVSTTNLSFHLLSCISIEKSTMTTGDRIDCRNIKHPKGAVLESWLFQDHRWFSTNIPFLYQSLLLILLVPGNIPIFRTIFLNYFIWYSPVWFKFLIVSPNWIWSPNKEYHGCFFSA